PGPQRGEAPRERHHLPLDRGLSGLAGRTETTDRRGEPEGDRLSREAALPSRPQLPDLEARDLRRAGPRGAHPNRGVAHASGRTVPRPDQDDSQRSEETRRISAGPGSGDLHRWADIRARNTTGTGPIQSTY